jgi:hypothetical protein
MDSDDDDDDDDDSDNPGGAPSSTLKLPIIIAPTAFQNLTCADGEIATARASARAGAGYSYNWMLSSKSYLDVLQASAFASASMSESDHSVPESGGGMWLHLYMYEERDMVEKTFGWQRRRVPFPPLSSLATIRTREFRIAWCRILSRCCERNLLPVLEQ